MLLAVLSSMSSCRSMTWSGAELYDSDPLLLEAGLGDLGAFGISGFFDIFAGRFSRVLLMLSGGYLTVVRCTSRI